MKKLLTLVLALAFCVGFAACSKPEDGGLSVGGGSGSGSLLPSTSDSSSEPQIIYYDIRYTAVIDGVVSTQAIPQDCFQTGKSYPTRYEYGKGATVDNLQSSNEYEFGGWYVNEACTSAFSGTISTTQTNEVKLYAKLTTNSENDDDNGGGSSEVEPTYYDIRYVMVENGTVSTQAIPDVCKQEGKSYPARYEYGVGVTVDALQSAGGYEFGGWYVNEACTNAFSGTIGATDFNEVTLYAKFTTQATITYRAIVNGKEKNSENEYYTIVDGFWKDGGAYPTTYQYGQSTSISPLNGECTVAAKHSSTDYTFEGWYIDAACTEQFNGVIIETQRGNVVIYAKISYEAWVGPY